MYIKNFQNLFCYLQNKFSNGSFFKNAGILTSGTLVSQAIVFIFYPVLTRLYTPAEFGIVSVTYMIASLLAIFASGAAEGAILIAKSRRSAAHIIGWIVIRSTFILLGFLLLAIFVSNINTNLIDKDILFWLPIIPILAAATIYFNCFSEWFLREKEFYQLARFRILQSLAISLLRTLCGLVNSSANGLVIGEIFGKLFIAIMGVRLLFFKNFYYFRAIKLKRINSERRRFKQFPMYMMPDQLINIAGGTVHIPFFALLFNSTELGYIAMSMSILYFPVSIISAAIKDVFRQRAVTELQLTGSCKTLYLKLLLPVTLIGFIGFGLIYLLSPWLFVILLGENWAPVGDYNRILAPMFFFNFVSMSMGGVLVVTQRLGLSLSWQIINLSMTLVALIIGAVVFKSVIATLWGITIAKSLAYLMHMILSYRFSYSHIGSS